MEPIVEDRSRKCSVIYFSNCQEPPDVPEGGGQVQRMVCIRLRHSQSTAVHHASRPQGKNTSFYLSSCHKWDYSSLLGIAVLRICIDINADPDQAFCLNADPDLGTQTNADPDPGHLSVGFKVYFYMKSVLYVGNRSLNEPTVRRYKSLVSEGY
jgi:hypothetical protein